jgi:hypothetical protein
MLAHEPWLAGVHSKFPGAPAYIYQSRACNVEVEMLLLNSYFVTCLDACQPSQMARALHAPNR